MVNTTYKIILQNTKAALQHTGMQHTTKILEIKGDVCHDQHPKVNLMFLSISFFKLFLISVYSSHSYLLTE